MMLFDMLMKGPDSFWKRKFHAEEIRRNKAEADLAYYKDSLEQMEQDRNRLSERDICQYRAIEAMNKEIENLKRTVSEKEQENTLLRDALRSERELSTTLRMNSTLWANLKERRAENGEAG